VIGSGYKTFCVCQNLLRSLDTVKVYNIALIEHRPHLRYSKDISRSKKTKTKKTFFLDLFPVSFTKDADRSTTEFLESVLDILVDHVRKSNDRKTKILDWHQPNQLRDAMDFSLPDQPQNLDQGRIETDKFVKLLLSKQYSAKFANFTKFLVKNPVDFLLVLISGTHSLACSLNDYNFDNSIFNEL
jgi:hypothetical protein